MSDLEDPVVATDTVAQRRHRAHQGRWRRDVLGLPAGVPPARVRTTYPTLGNYLPADQTVNPRIPRAGTHVGSGTRLRPCPPEGA